MRHLIEPYVTGRLDADEAERFEDYLLEHPEVAQEVEDGLRLRRGLARVAAQDTAVAVGAAAVVAARRRSWAPWVLAGVATLGLAASWMWWMPRMGDLEQALAAARAPRAGTPVVTLEATRSTGDAVLPTLRLEQGQPWLVLLLEPTHPGSDFYLVHVEMGERSPGDPAGSLWRSSPTPTDPRGRLSVSLPADLLEAGPVTLRVEAIDGDGPARPAGRFAFELVD